MLNIILTTVVSDTNIDLDKLKLAVKKRRTFKSITIRKGFRKPTEN